MIQEERRTKVWQITTWASLIAAVAVIAFFVIRIMTNNPLSGVWTCTDSDAVITVKSSGKMTVSWPDSDKLSDMSVDLEMEPDRDEQTVKIWIDAEPLKEAAAAASDQATLRSDISRLCGVFSYESEGTGLMLTDTQSGDSVEFEKRE